FLTEAAIAAKLDHPNIIRIYDAQVEENRAYLVMEFIDGQPLDHYCEFNTMLPLPRAVSIVFKCAMALDYAFRHGVVHRDIKPANILIGANDLVKVTDFGLALNVAKENDKDSTFIMGVGSPAYMSPEQVKGYPLNQKTDLYSLGVVLFHLLTGRLPFRAKHPAQLIYKIINADPPSASQLNPEVPEAMDRVIRKALEKDLYSRYKNGAEFAKDLSTVRFKILDDKYVPPDTTRFSILRKMTFFTEFDDVEVWEVLRFSNWRQYTEGTVLMREGDSDNRFGLIVSGHVRVVVGGRLLAELGPGEVVGEMGYLDPNHLRRSATVIASSPVAFLEVSPSALALASEECLEHFRAQLISTVVQRLARANSALAAQGEQVVLATESGFSVIGGGIDLELLPDTPARR
ncbi:MAG: protein kinase, partial [Methyloversatilis sp.]|nr:protein kinase [Methyloversatilis sp.]